MLHRMVINMKLPRKCLVFVDWQ